MYVRRSAAIQKNMWQKSNFHFVQGYTKNTLKTLNIQPLTRRNMQSLLLTHDSILAEKN